MAKPKTTHIVSKCPACRASYRLRVAASGRQARCKSCGVVFVVPGEQLSLEDSVLSWLDKSSRRGSADRQANHMEAASAGKAESAAQDAPPSKKPKPAAPKQAPAMTKPATVEATPPKPLVSAPKKASAAVKPKPKPKNPKPKPKPSARPPSQRLIPLRRSRG